MSTYWLNGELKGVNGVKTDGRNPILSVRFGEIEERVYCPDAGDYRVTADVVKRAKEHGATIVAYSASWGEPTYEGKRFGEINGVKVMPYSAFFAYLRQHGIKVNK